MKLTFHGGTKMVTGANYLLESGDTKILIDCGLHQGSNFCEKHNWEPFPYRPEEIAAVFVTHAHIDHTGRLPKLIRDGFRGTVYATPPTRDAAELLLMDADHILEEEAKRFKQPLLYTSDDVTRLMSHWKGIPYHESVAVGPFRVTLWNAGHVLGSSSIEVNAEGKTIVFSGDLGNSPAPLIGSSELFTKGADYCLIESVYGDRIHENPLARKEILEDLIEDTVKTKGVLMIPAFAMERTQELLSEMNDLAEQGRIPPIPVFLDSPLAIRLTDVYRKYTSFLDAESRNRKDDLFSFRGLRRTLTTEESKAINDVPPPKVIIAGSGMSHGGRILHHERRYLPDPKSTLLIVGYQTKGSLGRQLLDGEPEVKLFGERVPVRCHIKAIGGYSAHADQNQLVTWIAPMKLGLRKVFVVQGEEEASEALKERLVDELALHTEIPELGETVIL